jgi:hypothetical protein
MQRPLPTPSPWRPSGTPTTPVRLIPVPAPITYLTEKDHQMAAETRTGSAGIGLGGILVIVGIVLAIVWSLWIGIIIALVGLVAFGGFAKGKWY